MTNNLNFGNPEKPHIAWQLTEAVRGLGDACRALDVPVVGGNVSLYNEGATGPIYPTPVVGMVGRAARRAPRRAARASRATGDAVALVGDVPPVARRERAGKLRGEPLPDGLPGVDVAAVRAAHEAVRDAVRAGALTSCHDIAEGGFARRARRVLPGGRDRRDARPAASAEPMADAVRRGPGRLRRLRPAGGARRARGADVGRVLGDGRRRRAAVAIAGRSLSLRLRRAARGARGRSSRSFRRRSTAARARARMSALGGAGPAATFATSPLRRPQ